MAIGYIKRKKLGEGTYATIYLADEIETEDSSKIYYSPTCTIKPIRKVAIKKIKRSDMIKGLDLSAIREIKSLRKIDSRYVIKILNVFYFSKTLNLVLEYVESNLEIIIKDRSIIIMPEDIKAWSYMILRGLFACHSKFILHRDIKPNNILITVTGIVKLADFGLSRSISTQSMTPQAITRWYRPPELLLGSKLYSFGVDMWSFGCVFAELFLRTPYFPGDDDIKQLDTIFKALGTPSEKDWPSLTLLPNFIKFPIYQRHPLKNLFSAVSDDALDLLSKLLTYDPSKRITCLNALKHPYFINLPRPTIPEKLPFSE
ncbi:serine/threonine kinase [Hamiltosporidium magnivora]|uniref:[RNA-polymerase]-subunit kinase n=1 Tax=Hamiltosporidium magnivora TaxID=148818 RepID=A0A4Q9L676_9MICR|nr:serine/threonine kinase [Hamiltosporidium magnivora]TBU09334.1 serine/threonine kinase [Hamiltosporidium magnivora]